MKRILITGSEGFIGKNLVSNLNHYQNFFIKKFNRKSNIERLPNYLKEADYIFHLAGENRSKNDNDFKKNNIEFTRMLCENILLEIKNSKRKIKLIFTSSIHVEQASSYGKSKLEAENIIKEYSQNKDFLIDIYRLPSVFGKWCKPNYNSVVATFCHNISRENPIIINDTETKLRLVYIDDVIKGLIDSLSDNKGTIYQTIEPEYSVSLGELAAHIRAFKSSRESLMIEDFGSGLLKALYSTYLSYLPSDKFSYLLKKNIDPRGKFVEVFKSSNFGQISYLTINPNQERGGHYHHTKTEKFLVLKGQVLFRYRNLITKEFLELKTSASDLRVVDTIPGWAHDIVNISSEEAIIMIWSNEIYDPKNPDTIQNKVIL